MIKATFVSKSKLGENITVINRNCIDRHPNYSLD